MELTILNEKIFYKNILVGRINKRIGKYSIQGFDVTFENLKTLVEYFLNFVLPELMKEELDELSKISPSSIICKTELGDHFIEILQNLSQKQGDLIASTNTLDFEILINNGYLTEWEGRYQITVNGRTLIEKLNGIKSHIICRRCGKEIYTTSRNLCPTCYTSLITADDYKRFH
ncbi:hypothetical protein [Peribacillus sp. SCS-37]|uniref:hypothetical protein n=1 Tax=Paraperibacillus esterisolvens TaxID=3115296 RepID=UPI00390592D0